MADNVPITPGSGADIATDQVTGTGEQVQLVKLAISTDGSRTLIPADGTNGLKTDVSNACLPVGDGTNIVTIDTDPADAEPNSGNAIHSESRTYIYNGSTWDRVRGDISNGMDVDVTRVGGNVTVVGGAADGSPVTGNPVLVAGTDGTNAQTLSVDTTGALNVDVVGNVASDSADSGAPVKVGNKAVAGVSGVTLVAANDRTDAYAGLDGVPIVRPYCGLEDIVSARISDTAGAAVDIIAAQGAGVKTYLTTVALYNSSTTNVFADILDGATIKLTLPLPALGGAVINLPVPLAGTANTAWRLDVSAATTTVYATAVGFKSKV